MFNKTTNNNELKELFPSDYKNTAMPDDMKSKILLSMDSILCEKPKRKQFVKKQVFAYLAAALCFIMLASAAGNAVYNYYYIPSKGFVNSEEYEVYSLPAIQTLGDKTIEGIFLTKHEGKNSLQIFFTNESTETNPSGTLYYDEFNVNIITAENVYEIKAEPTRLLLETWANTEQEITFAHWEVYTENFEDAIEFELCDSEGNSVKITLEPSNIYSDDNTSENNNVKIRFYQISDGSLIYGYSISQNVLPEIEELFGSEMSATVTSQLMYDKDGYLIKYPHINYLTDNKYPGTNDFRYMASGGGRITASGEWRDILWKSGPKSRTFSLGKTVIKEMLFMCFALNDGFDTGVDIPVPADGEKIEFEIPLVVFDYYGFRCVITSVERDGKYLFLYNGDDEIIIQYNGDKDYIKEPKIKLIADYRLLTPYVADERRPFGSSFELRISDDEVLKLSKGNYIVLSDDVGDTCRLKVSSLSFTVTGKWEINY